MDQTQWEVSLDLNLYFRVESGFGPPPEEVFEWRETARRATMAR